MSLSDHADLASVIASLAVVLTLPMLIISIRQNTKTQRAIVVDSLAKGIADINSPLTADPAIGAAVQATTEDWLSATKEQRIMAHYFLYSILKLHENAWYQMRAGILEPNVWQGWETNMRAVYHMPGVKNHWWKERAPSYSQEFRGFLAGTEPLGIGKLSDIFDPESEPSQDTDTSSRS